MVPTSEGACWRLFFSFIARRRLMVCSTSNVTRWVGAVAFGMAILLAVETL